MGQVVSAVKDQSGLYNIEVMGESPDNKGVKIQKINNVYRYTVPSNIIELVKNAPPVNLFDQNLPENQMTLALRFLGFLPKENVGPNYDPSKPTYVYFPPESLETGEKPNILTTIFAMETNDMTMSVPPKDYPFAIDPCPPGIVCKVPKSPPADNFYMILIGVILVILVAMMLWK